jgi:hypothetical protein
MHSSLCCCRFGFLIVKAKTTSFRAWGYKKNIYPGLNRVWPGPGSTGSDRANSQLVFCLDPARPQTRVARVPGLKTLVESYRVQDPQWQWVLPIHDLIGCWVLHCAGPKGMLGPAPAGPRGVVGFAWAGPKIQLVFDRCRIQVAWTVRQILTPYTPVHHFVLNYSHFLGETSSL